MASHESSYPRISTREQTYINSQQQNSIQSETIFYLCDTCFWCATILESLCSPLKIDVLFVRIQNFPTFLYYLTNHLHLIIITNAALNWGLSQERKDSSFI